MRAGVARPAVTRPFGRGGADRGVTIQHFRLHSSPSRNLRRLTFLQGRQPHKAASLGGPCHAPRRTGAAQSLGNAVVGYGQRQWPDLGCNLARPAVF